MKNIIVAIDGYSSCGKSTLAKQLATHLNYRYVDTGAMYRAVALFALNQGLIDETGKVNVEELVSRLHEINIDFRYNNERKASDTYLNNENVETEIRGMRVSNMVSKVSIIKQVRQAMIALQQNMGKDKAIVMDGRDIGTAVFPGAELKLFMTADPDVRVKRRLAELEAKGDNVSYDEVKQNLLSRDFDDIHRAENPLVQADDAVVIDNTFLTKAQQFQQVLDLIARL